MYGRDGGVRDRVLKSPLTEIKTGRGGVREDLLLHLGADYFFIHDAAPHEGPTTGWSAEKGRPEYGRGYGNEDDDDG